MLIKQRKLMYIPAYVINERIGCSLISVIPVSRRYVVLVRVTRFEFVKKRTLRCGGGVVYSPPPRRNLPKAQNDRIWRIIIVHLATLRRRSTNDIFLYSQSSRKKVERKGDTLSKTCKGVITSL